MDIIFKDGAKVNNKEVMDLVSSILNKSKNSKTGYMPYEYNIYGDDYKIEIDSRSTRCVFALSDYDETQNLEYRTIISFTKDELSHIITSLSSIYDKIRL